MERIKFLSIQIIDKINDVQSDEKAESLQTRELAWTQVTAGDKLF